MGMTFREPAVPTIDQEKCSRCGRCAEACSTGTLAIEDGEVSIAKRSFMDCIACGHCMTVCPSDAIRVSGRRFSADDVVDLPRAAQRASADQLDGLLLARRSVRKFTAQEVGRSDVDRILAMTSTAPMGIPPTDKHATAGAVLIVRIADGRIVEDWLNLDQLGLLQQLGVIPSITGA